MRPKFRKNFFEYDEFLLLYKHPVKNICFILSDEEGSILGGITGTIFWYSLHIDSLWVDESLRGKGYGKELLTNIENIARENRCKLIQLDTFSFQSPTFYQKNGFECQIVILHPILLKKFILSFLRL
ncbi:GNAT family N-acetyltransferase [Peribacillus simplex]